MLLQSYGKWGMVGSGQNLERVALRGKILQNNELALLRAAGFSILQTADSYCLRLNTEHSF
jgi:hypothetical protein